MSIDGSFVFALANGAPRELALVGGKARNLMQLVDMGLGVPAGFCLTTEAYCAFVNANGLGGVVQASLEEFTQTDRTARLAACERIRHAFLHGALPAELASTIEAHYRQLSGSAPTGCHVAVRSSATAEDLANASFAGGQETVLNVYGLAPLYDAIRACWASLWTERVIAYRRRLGVNDSGLALAVIVQKMVKPLVSGVLFSLEPVTGNRELLVLEACWGLGEALVSGRVTPEHYEVERATLEVRRRSGGGQAEMLECADSGIQLLPTPERLRNSPCLNAEQVGRLTRMALAIEEHFGSPQDIEWAISAESPASAEQIWILQSRPITSLKQQAPVTPPGVAWQSPVPGAVWVRRSGGMVEYLPTPPSPLYATAQLPAICRLHDLQCVEMNVVTPPPTSALINGYFYNRQDYRLGPGAILLPYRYWKAARRGAKWWRGQVLPAQLACLSELSAFDISKATREQLLDHLRELLAFNALAWDNAVRASRTYVFTEPLFRRVFNWFVRPVAGGDAVTYLRGFESQVMAGERAQWQLVRLALLSPEVSRCIQHYASEQALERLASLPACQSWLENFLDYCHRYGHVTASHDFLYSTVADDPAKALNGIRIRMEMPPCDPEELRSRMAAEREKATADAMERLRRFPLRKALFRWVLSWAQEGATTREDIFFHALLGWPLARRTILQLAQGLVEAGAFASPQDVFFLTWEQLQQAAASQGPGDWHASVAAHRAEHQFRSQLSPPPCIPIGGPSPTLQRKLKARLKRFIVDSSRESRRGLLRGAPVSPGKVTGPARIIHSTSELGRLQSGDILVTRSTTPEWTPTFAIAAGLVTDVGGPLSHSSIIAREFGIPAVMGVQIATSAIAEGQLVTVDGSEGSIRLH